MTASSAIASDGTERRSVYLHAGQLHVSSEPCEVVTILGSCVAVCLFDPDARVGGVNHYLLPVGSAREASTRYGTHAIPQLLERVLAGGARREALRAKVFGGACTLQALPGRNLGQENVDVALRLLEEQRIPVAERDVGGKSGRKLVFHTDVGAAWVRRL